jgi:hypothetical protein
MKLELAVCMILNIKERTNILVRSEIKIVGSESSVIQGHNDSKLGYLLVTNCQ